MAAAGSGGGGPVIRLTDSTARAFSVFDWEAKLEEVALDEEDMDRLVLDYLIAGGFEDAAKSFARESGLGEVPEDCSLSHRQAVRTSIMEGRLDDAISHVNDLNPEILENNADLMFHMKCQQLVELMRAGDLAAALAFAQEELAPRCEEKTTLLPALEDAMSLFAFPDTAHPAVAWLAGADHKFSLAADANAAVLDSLCADQDSRLDKFLHLFKRHQDTQRRVGRRAPVMELDGTMHVDPDAAPSTTANK